MNARRLLFPAVALAALALATVATAQVSYQPLAEGNTWTYITGPGGDVEAKLITGRTTILDHEPWVMEYHISSENLGLLNYWTEGEGGDVLIHGFWRDGWGAAYDPPILMVDAPLEPGKTWSTTFDRYSLPDLVYEDTWTVTFQVEEAGTYELPAGSFEGFGIGSIADGLVTRDGRRYGLDGRALGAADRDADTWWSLGVGEIQYQTSSFFMLESYQLGSVAVETRTWTGVKALFD